jgi:hypothetical protein
MTQQEIQERNEQIALMLGLTPTKGFGSKKNEYYKKIDGDKTIIYNKVLFHSDWNWLMEAVEFIENLDLNDIFTMPEFNYHVGKMTLFRVNKDVLKKMPITSKKESIFISVSDFAKLYNKKEL